MTRMLVIAFHGALFSPINVACGQPVQLDESKISRVFQRTGVLIIEVIHDTDKRRVSKAEQPVPRPRFPPLSAEADRIVYNSFGSISLASEQVFYVTISLSSGRMYALLMDDLDAGPELLWKTKGRSEFSIITSKDGSTGIQTSLSFDSAGALQELKSRRVILMERSSLTRKR